MSCVLCARGGELRGPIVSDFSKNNLKFSVPGHVEFYVEDCSPSLASPTNQHNSLPTS
jgi:hypothetical protein